MNTSSSLSWRRLGLLVGVWAMLGGGALLAPGCYGHNCEGSPRKFGLDAGEGEMLDENVWESTPPTSNWLPFPRQTTYFMTLPLGGRTPADVRTMVSAQPNPGVNGSATNGAGNLTEFSWGPNSVTVTNDTCSDYYLRVVVWAPPFPDGDAAAAPASTTETDASTKDDAGAVDAGPDAH